MAASTPGTAARRAEQVRQAAIAEFFKMDDIMAVNRALVRQAPVPEALPVGAVVYYWRTQGGPHGTVGSRRRQAVENWRGPGVIVAKQGTSKYYVAMWGTIVMVSPEQLTAASPDEAGVFEQIEELARLVGPDLESVRQKSDSSMKEEADRQQ